MSIWPRWPGVQRTALVRTTVGSRRDAEALAKRLVDGRLAACVHVTETSSVYRWTGRVQQETEFLVEGRTLIGRPTTRLAEAMLAGHPYQEPLVEAVPSLVNRRYYDWVRGEVA